MFYLINTSIVNDNFSLSQNIKLFVLGKSAKKISCAGIPFKANSYMVYKMSILYCKDLLTNPLFVKHIQNLVHFHFSVCIVYANDLIL